jgi:hypothetical protein
MTRLRFIEPQLASHLAWLDASLASVFTTLLALRRSLTTNWPVIALRDCSVAAKSACPPAWGKMRFAGLAVLTRPKQVSRR